MARRDELRSEIEATRAKMEPLQLKIDDLTKQIVEIDTFLAQYERFSGVAITSVEQTPESQEVAQARPRRKQPVTPAELAIISAKILSERGRPLTRGQLATGLENRGVYLHGSNPAQKAKYVGTILWRKPDEFVNIDGHGYWPATKPYAPANYKPNVFG